MESPQSSHEKMLEAILSVSEFIEYINLLIGRKQVAVEGEISGFNVSQGKWVFFDLKDESSTVTCFTMLYRLETQLADGMKVKVTGVPRIHQKSGRFSIFVDKIELSGEGALRKAFELTKAKLEKEGIFDLARKRSIARFPGKIGLICSRESAAYTDFMRIVNQRWGGLEIQLAHVHVQGGSAIQEITGAFAYFNTADTGVETIVLIRGGGSLEDLQAFNSEAVARAVFGSHIPVICGVGHERDESLADYAADIRAATPTHAATLVIPDQKELLLQIDGSARQLEQSMSRELEWHGHHVDHALSILYHGVADRLLKFTFLLRNVQTHLQSYAMRISDMAAHSDAIGDRLAVLFAQRQERIQTSLSFLLRNLENMSPLNVVKRGYGIVKRNGRVIKRASDARVGDDLAITLSDGDLKVVVSDAVQSLNPKS